MELGALKPGMTGRAELLVGEEHTAPRVGSGKVHVLATPVMINLIEAAALDAVERLPPPGYQNPCTLLQVRHIAATPLGMRVRARATGAKNESRPLLFRVGAHYESEAIRDRPD